MTMRKDLFGILFVALALYSCSRSGHTPETSAGFNKALYRRAIDIWGAGDVSALGQVIASDYVGHVSTGNRDQQALRQRIETIHRLYSEVAFHVEDQLADGDKVITRLSVDLTLRDTGGSAKLMGINISRIAHGKIAEEWETWEPVTKEESKN